MRSGLSVTLIILLFIFSGNQVLASILPLANTNQWTYQFRDQSPGITPVDAEVNLELGGVETIDDICIRPLIFGDEQLSLYILNQNEVLVLYGFRGVINQREVEFFFHSGDKVSVYSGVPLAGIEDQFLLQDQIGKQTKLINEQPVNIEWEVRGKEINRVELTESFAGEVASEVETINSGELYTFKFYLYLGPCKIEGGCNVGIFTFTFLPDVGLTNIRLQGDHPEFGGQFDQVFNLLPYPNSAFSLESNESLIGHVPCQSENTDGLQRSKVGNIVNWFNIFLLLVVVLRGFSRSGCILFRMYQSR